MYLKGFWQGFLVHKMVKLIYTEVARDLDSCLEDYEQKTAIYMIESWQYVKNP